MPAISLTSCFTRSCPRLSSTASTIACVGLASSREGAGSQPQPWTQLKSDPGPRSPACSQSLLYQRITADAQPIGPTRQVPFVSMQLVKVLLGDQVRMQLCACGCAHAVVCMQLCACTSHILPHVHPVTRPCHAIKARLGDQERIMCMYMCVLVVHVRSGPVITCSTCGLVDHAARAMPHDLL